MKAIERTPLRCGDLCGDAVVVGAAIISQREILGCAPLCIDGNVADTSIGHQQGLRCRLVAKQDRLDEHIAILLSAPRSADMRLRETLDDLGHGRPTSVGHRQAVGAWLHHAKGHGRADECAAKPLTPDTRIDMGAKVMNIGCRRKGMQRQKEEQQG